VIQSHSSATQNSGILPALGLGLVALLVAFSALIIVAVAPAQAGSGGLSVENEVAATEEGSEQGKDRSAQSARSKQRYQRYWERVSGKDKRWARNTSDCESGGDPNAIGGGGLYRGAFQFHKSTWRAAPRSPGGDPIKYNYKTQAVVAVALKKADGAQHWPNCG